MILATEMPSLFVGVAVLHISTACASEVEGASGYSIDLS